MRALIIIPTLGHGNTRQHTEDCFFFSIFRVLPWLKSLCMAGTMMKATVRTARLAGAHRESAVAVHIGSLLGNTDDDHDRSARCAFGMPGRPAGFEGGGVADIRNRGGWRSRYRASIAGPHAASESSILFSAASQKSSAELCWLSAVSQRW